MPPLDPAKTGVAARYLFDPDWRLSSLKSAAYVGILIVALLAFSTLSAQSKSRRVYVSAVDAATSMPVSDLAVADLMVKEDGVDQTVTKVALSNHPMRIALLVDTTDISGYVIADLRAALDSFIEAVPAPHEILLVSTGQQVRVRVQPTADHKKLKDATKNLFYDGHGGGTLLFDALNEVDRRFLKNAVDLSPVIVIVTGDGREASQRYDEKAFTQLANSIALRGIQAHAAVFSRGAIQAPASMAQYLASVTKGRADLVPVSSTLPQRLKALADAIVENDRKMATWYEIDYLTTSKSDQPATEVGMVRQGIRTQVSAVRRLP